MTIWVVVFGNYEPSDGGWWFHLRVDSLWATKELAQKRADELDDDWRVVEWMVGTE